MTIDTPTESSAMLAGATQLAGLLVVAHATVVDARYALSTASRHDLDLRLRWQQAAARADEVVRVEHERNHEIRSGLLAVEGAGKLLSQRLDGGGDGAAASLADAVQREVSRLQRIAAPIEDDPPTSYGLLDVLEPLVVAHRATGQRIRLDVPPDLDAEGRPHVLAEVMSNLLVNSARHAPDARVTITGSPGSRPGFTRVVVADDGPGFPAGGLVHALERGWRGFGSSALGSGLGLYLSSHLMELEGGALKLQPPALGTHGAVVALEVRAGRGPSVQAALDVLADAS
jgi:signal transduction histidine kinase